MFAYRTHERLNANTNLRFTPILGGRPVNYESEAKIDGNRAGSGQHVSIGWHTLALTHPKTKPFSTNLFIWYGEHDLGKITLERTKGMLAIAANPPARRLSIRGPEFSITLTNSSGMTSSVPTDSYVVEAVYRRWKDEAEIVVLTDRTTGRSFAPKLGTLQIEASHPDSYYQLRALDRNVVDFGPLPATATELPEGNYQLVSKRKAREQEMTVTVKAGTTNVARAEFLYGATQLETQPSGARVVISGRDYGVTALTLSELKPGSSEFMLSLTDYESVAGLLVITANETNRFSTNLVSRYYTMAIEQARRYFAGKDFNRAAEAARDALKHKPDDIPAKNLERDATGYAHLVRAETLAQQGKYADAIKEVNAGLTILPDNENANALLSDYTNREQQRIEAEKKRQEELAEMERKRREAEQEEQRAQERIKHLQGAFDVLVRGFENSPQFAQHELVTTKDVTVVGEAIKQALFNGQPSFEIVRFERPRPDIFGLQARQRVGMGYRDCLIVGGQIRENKTQILFKVLEYEQPPELNLLVGLLTVSGGVKITSQDPNVANEKVERFQVRVKEGVQIVRERVQRAIQP